MALRLMVFRILLLLIASKNELPFNVMFENIIDLKRLKKICVDNFSLYFDLTPMRH
jgi:hypothetical protein